MNRENEVTCKNTFCVGSYLEHAINRQKCLMSSIKKIIEYIWAKDGKNRSFFVGQQILVKREYKKLKVWEFRMTITTMILLFSITILPLLRKSVLSSPLFRLALLMNLNFIVKHIFLNRYPILARNAIIFNLFKRNHRSSLTDTGL